MFETAKKVYLTAAGHKYGQQSLPLYLFEMKHLPQAVDYVLLGDEQEVITMQFLPICFKNKRQMQTPNRPVVLMARL